MGCAWERVRVTGWVGKREGAGLGVCGREKGRFLVMGRARERTLVKKSWWMDGCSRERGAAGLRVQRGAQELVWWGW